MKTDLGKNGWGGASDEEIERDVSELRSLLSPLPGPAEPHPAYYQNFLVRVRGRIDEQGGRRRRVMPSAIWASLSAAVVVVALAVGGVFSPSAVAPSGEKVAQKGGNPTDLFAKGQSVTSIAAANPLYSDQGVHSLILSKDDVQMLNALNTDDDNAILDALADSESL